jgi:hypothetical protein
MEGLLKRRWAIIALVIVIAIVLIAATVYVSGILGNDGLAKRSANQIMLPSIDIPGKWERAQMPLEMGGGSGALYFNDRAFWFNNTNGSEAMIGIWLLGYGNITVAKQVYEQDANYDPPHSRTMNMGDNATALIRDNYSAWNYSSQIVWTNSCVFFVLKMNYVCIVGIFYQNSSGLDALWASQVAQEQVNRVQ